MTDQGSSLDVFRKLDGLTQEQLDELADKLATKGTVDAMYTAEMIRRWKDPLKDIIPYQRGDRYPIHFDKLVRSDKPPQS